MWDGGTIHDEGTIQTRGHSQVLKELQTLTLAKNKNKNYFCLKFQ